MRSTGTVIEPAQKILSNDRRLVRAEALAQLEEVADGARERGQDFSDIAAAPVFAEAFEVDAQRRACRARAGEAQYDARAVFEEDADALARGRRAVHRVRVAEVVGALDAALAERRARERGEAFAQRADHLGGGRGVERLVVVALVVAAAELAPVFADDLRDRLPRRRENREPREDGPQAVLLAHVVRARAEALLAADGHEPRVHEVAEELP